MIYNLFEYISTALPNISFVANGFDIDTPEDAIAINKEGGTPTPNFPRTEHAVQIFSRARTTVNSQYNIMRVFNLLKNRFHLLLPSVTVNDIFYDEIQTYQITANQEPGYLGNDDKNGEMYSFNLKIITK